MKENSYKKCRKCHKSKSFDDFGLCSSNKEGLLSTCKECTAIYQKKTYRSELSIIKRMYNSQIRNSKIRNHERPSYTKEELADWVLSRPNFKELYDNWVNSGYSRKLIPSIDRLKDDVGYCFSNIQLMTWNENNSKPRENARGKRKDTDATTVSNYIDGELLEALDDYVKTEGEKRFPERVNRSGIISKFIKEGLEKHNPNYKQKKILENYHGSSKK